jgi:endo-1,4-beta-xylanase
MNRRGALLASGACLAQMGFAAAQTAQPSEPTLNDLAMRQGRRFGFAIDPSYSQKPAVKPLLAHAGVLTAENGMKWARTHVAPDSWSFSRAKAVATQAQALGALLCGHALGWHQSMPGWVSTVDAPAYVAAMTAHVKHIAGHFAGQIDTWDVLNEVIEPDHKQSGGMRESVLSKLWRIERYPLFFEIARQADPKARLAYNDYGLEQDEAWCDRRRAATLKLLEGWVARGTPLDVLGVQAHLNASSKFSQRKLSDFLDQVRALGLTVQITELDVRDTQVQGDIAARDAAVASMYKAFADVCLSHSSVEMIVLWNVTDADSWLNDKWNRAPQRADGLPSRPTLFDESGQPKPAFAALQQSLRDAKTAFVPEEKKNV